MLNKETILLYIFSGLPGVGKSVLSQYLSQYLKAVYLRVDSIEQTMKNHSCEVVYDEGYQIAFKLAMDNLTIGNTVVADSVNPIEASREAWLNVAIRSNAEFYNIEIICSDITEHRQRVEQRLSDIDSLKLPTWDQVMMREYSQWNEERIVIDTAGRSIVQSKMDLLLALGLPVI